MILLKAKLTETRPLDVARDAWGEITKGAYRATGQYWVDNMLQRHFEPGAAAKYQYQDRTLAWLLSKYGESKTGLRAKGIPRSQFHSHLKQRDDRQPLQFTGYMRRAVSSSHVIRGFPTRATIILYGPAYMNAKLAANTASRTGPSKYARVQPDKIREMTTVTAQERRELAGVLEAEILKRLNAYRGQRVTE